MRKGFDWNKPYYEGEKKRQHKKNWKEIVQDHPIECFLSCLLGIGVIVWTTIS